jgi:hypothetical protein
MPGVGTRWRVEWSPVVALVCLVLALPGVGDRGTMAAESPDRDAVAALLRDIETKTSRASALAKAGSYDEAIPLWFAAARRIEKFEAGLSPEDMERFSLFKPMALIRYAIGDCLNEAGRHREAVEELEKAEVCVRQYTANDPEERASWMFLVVVHTSKTVAFSELGEEEQADAERDALGKTCEEALRHHPRDKDLTEILEGIAAYRAGTR